MKQKLKSLSSTPRLAYRQGWEDASEHFLRLLRDRNKYISGVAKEQIITGKTLFTKSLAEEFAGLEYATDMINLQVGTSPWRKENRQKLVNRE